MTYDDGGVFFCACVYGDEAWSRGHGPQHTHYGGLCVEEGRGERGGGRRGGGEGGGGERRGKSREELIS